MSWLFNPFTGNLDLAGAGSATSPGGSDTQLQFNDGGSFGGATGLLWDKTTGTLTVSGAPLVLSGNISAASWGLNGLKLKGGGSTLTDTSGAGTVATGATNVLGGNTIAATNTRTITDYYTAYINTATAGTNVTLTNKWALGLGGSLQIAAGTFTAAQSALDISQTWNNAGVTFTGLKFNVTDTASSASSLLMDLQVGGSSKFKFDKAGFYSIGTGSAAAIIGSTGVVALQTQANNNGFLFTYTYGFLNRSDNCIGWTNSTTPATNAAPETAIYRDAANTIAQRNSTNAQENRIYATHTSATNYQRCSIKTGKTTLSNVTGASVTATGLIPAGALLIGVTSRVNTTCTTATGYTVGTAGDTDLWGVASAVSAGTATGSANFTAAGASGLFTAATDVVVTPTGGNFDGTGVIELAVHYLLTEAD